MRDRLHRPRPKGLRGDARVPSAESAEIYCEFDLVIGDKGRSAVSAPGRAAVQMTDAKCVWKGFSSMRKPDPSATACDARAYLRK